MTSTHSTSAPLRVSALQMVSGADLDANLAVAAELLARAAAAGATLAVLPENFAFMGRREADRLTAAEAPEDGPIQAFLAAQAREHGLWVVGGTIPVRVPDERRAAAACLVYDRHGTQCARYDKIHMFDVSIPGRAEETYRESDNTLPGDRSVVVDTPCGRLGLAVCYDVRFPELFRTLADEGADLIALPAAFTRPTGRAHWEILLRARAIENQCYVIGAAQGGLHANGRQTHGDSMIVDPWGELLNRLGYGPGLITADLDPQRRTDLHRDFPVLTHRRKLHD